MIAYTPLPQTDTGRNRFGFERLVPGDTLRVPFTGDHVRASRKVSTAVCQWKKRREMPYRYAVKACGGHILVMCL